MKTAFGANCTDFALLFFTPILPTLPDLRPSLRARFPSPKGFPLGEGFTERKLSAKASRPSCTGEGAFAESRRDPSSRGSLFSKTKKKKPAQWAHQRRRPPLHHRASTPPAATSPTARPPHAPPRPDAHTCAHTHMHKHAAGWPPRRARTHREREREKHPQTHAHTRTYTSRRVVGSRPRRRSSWASPAAAPRHGVRGERRGEEGGGAATLVGGRQRWGRRRVWREREVERWGRRRIWRKTSEGGSGGVRGAAAGRGGRRREDLGFCVCVWGGAALYRKGRDGWAASRRPNYAFGESPINGSWRRIFLKLYKLVKNRK
jgi:hypothetical protein